MAGEYTEEEGDDAPPPPCCSKCSFLLHVVREVCGLLCCPPVPSRIAGKLAFVPPLPSYDVRKAPDEGGDKPRYQLWLQPSDYHNTPGGELRLQAPTAEREGFTQDVEWLRTSNGDFIPAVFLHNADPEAEFTLLFSHGNGTDLGQMYSFLAMLATQLRVNIFFYEYSGYGASTASMPGEAAVIRDAEAAWSCLVEKHKVPPSRVILYGQSVGSGPSCSLAARENYQPAGLVLHSPIMSGMRVIMQVQRTFSIDPFPNIDLVPHVRCPVAVIHGKKDEVVPFEHGRKMYGALKKPFNYKPLWIENGGHNNIVGFASYYGYVRGFLASLLEAERAAGAQRAAAGAESIAAGP